MMNVYPATAKFAIGLQIIIALLTTLVIVYLVAFTGPMIDAEKHKASDQPGVMDILLFAAPILISVGAAYLLAKRKPSGWWVSITIDLLLGLVATVDVLSNIHQKNNLLHLMFEILPFAAALIFLMTRSARSCFGIVKQETIQPSVT